MKSLNTLTKLSMAQFKLFAREPIALFFTIAFPVLLLLLFGAIWGNDPFDDQPFGYVDTQVPALMAIIIGTLALIGIPVATATHREQRILRRFKATPLPALQYISADVLINFFISLLGVILLIIVGILVFDMRFFGNGFAVFGGFTLSTLAFIAVGYVIASLATTSRTAQVTGQLLFFPMMFLSGAALPLNIMPQSIQNIAQWLPMTHVVDLMQKLWLDGEVGATSILVLTAMLIVGTAVSAFIFRWE